MKEFKVGDDFIYCPDSKVCLLKIIDIGEWNDEKKCKEIKFKRHTYINNICDKNNYEEGTALILRDEERDSEYVQVDHWLTKRYCRRHIIYCE